MTKDISCRSVSDQSSFLWCLMYFYFIKHSLDEAIGLVSSMYEQKFELTTEFEKLLLSLWETRDTNYIVEIARKSVQQSLFDIEKHIFVVASLIEEDEISVSDAALLLRIDAQREYKNLDEKIKHVIDVAWLVNEDAKDGVMSPNDDRVLVEALRQVKTFDFTPNSRTPD